MIKKKHFGYILTIILVAAIIVQIFKSDNLTTILKINQQEPDINFKHLSAPVPENYKNALVIYSRDEISNKVYNNVYQTFRMAKIQAEFHQINAGNLTKAIDKLQQEDLLVIATTQLNKLNNYKRILNYTRNGGKTLFLVRSHFSPFDNLVGIKQNRGYYNRIINGFKFKKKIFPGLDKLEIKDDKVNHSILDVKLETKVKILAKAENKPLIWTTNYGQGRVLYVNSTLMESKQNRGLLLQYISYLPNYFLTTIFNGKIVNIDDFPAPIKPGKDEIIYKRYHMNNRMFYKHIWWSDLYNLAKIYNFKYTGLIIGTPMC